MKPHPSSSVVPLRRPLRIAVAALTLTLGVTAYAGEPANLPPFQTLSQGGVFPVNGLAGDAFGQVLAFNREFFFVSSPGSQPDNKSIAGAVFVYRWDGANYQLTQTITTAGTGDHLGMLQILSDHEWLVLSATGTPVGPQTHDAVTDQDFRGAVLIYRLNRPSGQWELHQILDQSTPGLHDLSVIGGGGVPVLLTPQGANFGLRMALDAERGWLLVSALYQDRLGPLDQTIINSGLVYAFRWHPSSGEWRLVQTITSPDGPAENDAFGAAVAVNGRYAMIGNGSVFQGPHLGNGAVYVYELSGGVWNYCQRLTGNQSGTTSLLFPQFSPDEIGVGDAFGNAIALDENHALITAPLESSPGTAFRGAAYFFERQRRGGVDEWAMTQRVESDDPQSLAFGVFNVALNGRIAVIGDIAWSGPAALAQGGAKVYRRRGHRWENMLTLWDAEGSSGAAFGAGIALGPGRRLAVGSSPFLGFFLPVVFRPPPPSFPPVAPGKVNLYELREP